MADEVIDLEIVEPTPAPRHPDGRLISRSVGRAKGVKNRTIERTRNELDELLVLLGVEANPLVKLLRLYMSPDTSDAIKVQSASALARHILPRLTEGSLTVGGSFEARGQILHGHILADPNLRRSMELAASKMASAQFASSPRFQAIPGSDRPSLPALPAPEPMPGSQKAIEDSKS